MADSNPPPRDADIQVCFPSFANLVAMIRASEGEAGVTRRVRKITKRDLGHVVVVESQMIH